MAAVNVEIARERRRTSQAVRKFRVNAKFQQDTLFQSCIRTIVKSQKYYLGQAENPFKDLPEVVVDEILKHMVDQCSFKEVDLWAEDFVLLLHNVNIREAPLATIRYRSDALKHVLENCPNIKKACVDISAWVDYKEFFTDASPYYSDLISAISINWQKLINLELVDSTFFCTHETFGLIQAFLPNLVTLGVCAVAEDHFDIKCVDHLSNMKQLKTLRLKIIKTKPESECDNSILAHACGRIPALQMFDCKYVSLGHNEAFEQNNGLSPKCLFVEEVCKNYPNIQLTLDSYRVIDTITWSTSWPPQLFVKNLTISGDFETIAPLLSIPCHVQTLQLLEMSPKQIYKLLEYFGPEVKVLHIRNVAENQSPLDLYKVFNCCPNMEDLNVMHWPISDGCVSKLTPGHLEKITDLYLPIPNDELEELYKMYFLSPGKSIARLSVCTPQIFKALMLATQQQPENCARLKALESVNFVSKQDQLVYKLAQSLLLISPAVKVMDFTIITDHPNNFLEFVASIRDFEFMNRWFVSWAAPLGISCKIGCLRLDPNLADHFNQAFMNVN